MSEYGEMAEGQHAAPQPKTKSVPRLYKQINWNCVCASSGYLSGFYPECISFSLFLESMCFLPPKTQA